MVYSVSSVSEFLRLKDEIQSILDGECNAGNLSQMHKKVALQNTLNTGGQDEDLTAIVNFIGHAAYIWKLFPSSDWKIQLHAALMVLEKIAHITVDGGYALQNDWPMDTSSTNNAT